MENTNKSEVNTFTTIVTYLVVIIVILKFVKEQQEMMGMNVKISLALILAGGISNLISIIISGNTMNIIKINVLNLPSFNIATVILIIGWILFALFMAINTVNTHKEIKEIDLKKQRLKDDMIGKKEEK